MSKPLSRGVHHLALNTDDMKMTLDFYLRVLGMPLVHALKVPPCLESEPRVVERWRQTRGEALAELRTLSDDQAWLETVVAHLPERRQAEKSIISRRQNGQARPQATLRRRPENAPRRARRRVGRQVDGRG